jgi:hypothetical protein
MYKELQMADEGPHKYEKEDEEDELFVPAGFFRVMLGLLLMIFGFFVWAMEAKSWAGYVGLVLFLCSFLIMLKKPDKESRT